MCGEKQSVKRHYGIGTAKDCRLHVQKLNIIRGEADNVFDNLPDDDDDDEDNNIKHDIVSNIDKNILPVKSKWAKFIDQSEDLSEVKEETVYSDNLEVALEVPTKRSKRLNKFKQKNENKDAVNEDVYYLEEKDLDSSYDCTKLKINEFDSQIQFTEISKKNSGTGESQCSLMKNDRISTSQIVQEKNTSKWAKYIDEDTNETTTCNISQNMSKNQKLLSMFDDDDIDEVLII